MRAPWPVRILFGVSLLALTAVGAAENAFTTHSVTVYAGPDDSYPPVADLDADSPVQVMGCVDDWSWCDVSFDDYRGWVSSPDIAYVYEGGYVPLYTYAPSLGIPVVQFSIGGYWDRYYHGRPWYAQRDEWIHHAPPHHRPPGPPPSAGPPPRSAWIERPGRDSRRAHEGEPERPLRLGSARDEQSRSAEPPRHVESPPAVTPPRPEERSPRHAETAEPGRAEAQRHEEAQHHEETERHEAQRPEAQHPEGARHEDARRAEKHREDRPDPHAQVPPR